ncbi:Lacal_2735 family protein [Winogradskyella ursingii]|uniref:Lacal_2735 family protein n=1 Tax=Winogradskyella ursingii TaxID=2686079 RepID=UPI0015CE17B6|nr:Lacal_2735 family protein [Winogradskyella ursingii]
MFGFFKKTSEVERLQKKHEQLLADWHRLSSSNRAESDKKYAEAEEIAIKIEQLKNK